MKNKNVAGILALVFPFLGVYRFYLGQTGKGILHILFFWTIIPSIISVVHGLKFILEDEATFHKKYNPADWALAQMKEEQARKFAQPVYAAPAPPPAPAAPAQDPYRTKGDEYFARYEFDKARAAYRKSLNVDPRQGDVHFQLACIESIEEHGDRALTHLSQALENGYYDFDEIEQHDHLAYLRSTPAYFAFKQNGYRVPSPASPVEAEETLELSDDLITGIERLARLKDDGILSEASFEREKAKLLRS